MSTEGGSTLGSTEHGNVENNKESKEALTVSDVDYEEHSFDRPNKEIFDRDISRINKDIKEKESQLKSLFVKAPSKDYYLTERDRLHNDIKATKERKESKLSEKKKVDEELRNTNATVQLRNEEIKKLQSKMPYKNERKIDAAIMRHENQLDRRQMLPEERKQIKQDIERLKSSKENLETYKELRSSLDQLKDKQKTLRANRDELVATLSSIRQEEDAIKGSFTKLKLEEDLEYNKYRMEISARDNLRKDIDELYKRKKEVSNLYHQKMSAYQKQLNKETRRKSRVSGAGKVVKSASMKTLKVERKKPYDEQIASCGMLISYLEKTFPSNHSDAEDGKAMPSRGSASQLDIMARDNDDQLSGIYSGIRRRPSKRERKQKKHQTAPELLKRCVHHPTVLSQFLQVDVLPPVAVADIVVTIQQLEEKKEFFLKQQSDLDEFATNLLTRRRSLEHLGDSTHSDHFERSYSITSGTSYESEARESDADSSPHRTRHTSENHDTGSAVVSGDDATESGSAKNGTTEEGEKFSPKEALTNDENGNLQDTMAAPVNRLGKSKVQFCIGDENEQTRKKIRSLPASIDDKLLDYGSVSALGRSKSLDSFRALHKDLDIPVTCRRARSISDKLCHPTDSFPDFGVVRSEL